MESGKTVHIKTFGCQMNVYDSNRMLSSLRASGYREEPNLASADVVLINTCSIRDKSEHKVLSLLGQLKPLKAQRPGMVIGISGCVGQRMGRTLLQRVPHLDLVLGPDSIDRIVSLVDSARSGGGRAVDTQMDAPGRTYTQPAIADMARPSEFLTIMKGCDHFCTYCIVPFVRGREKSRAINEVIEDVQKFVAKGSREVVFLGQNINTYGKGTKENLAQLVEAANQVEGLDRIRYVTSHPRDLGQDLIDQFGTVEKLCPALHLPFQSGSNRILKRMSRLYTREIYLEKIRLLRAARPDIALSTDVIVGFPGETEEDFQQTLDMVSEVKFSMGYMFKYSPRPGTRAFAFDKSEEVPEPLKEERLKRLQDVVNPLMEVENQALEGRVCSVLIESKDKYAQGFTGRSAHGKVVHVLNAGEACLGKIIDVEITESNASNLRGYYVEAPELTGDPKRDYPHRFNKPKIDPSAIVMPGAHVLGDVHLGKEANIWFNAVVRGDVNYIRIGDRTNVQDLSMIHVSYKASPTIIGSDVTIGHAVVLHACTIKDFALIGMGTVILDDAEIGEYSIIGAGSLVTKGTVIPPGSLAFGRPAKVMGQISDEDREKNRFSARHYVNLAKSYSS